MTTSHISTTPDETRFVVSQDGTRINYLSMGSGPSVIVIPGALSVAADYAAFGRALAGQFTVRIIERRGRGLSSPQGDDYGIAKECEDVLALQQQTGASYLVGHSFGGLVALEAARNNPAYTRIAVYEPGVSVDGSIPMGWMPGYAKKLAEQKYMAALVEFTRGVGPEATRNTPAWLMQLILPLVLKSGERKVMLGLLPENLAEHREVARLDNSYPNYREISAGVLLMYGGKSNTSWVETAVARLEMVLPCSQTYRFPQRDHFAIDKRAPAEVAKVVSAYFQNGQVTP